MAAPVYSISEVEGAIQIVFGQAGGDLRVRPGLPRGPEQRYSIITAWQGREAAAGPLHPPHCPPLRAGARHGVPEPAQGLAGGMEVLCGAFLGHALPGGQVLVPADAARGAARRRRRCRRAAAWPAELPLGPAAPIAAHTRNPSPPQVVRAYYTQMDAQSQSAVSRGESAQVVRALGQAPRAR